MFPSGRRFCDGMVFPFLVFTHMEGNIMSATTTKFFDLHTSGIGYMKRLRFVSPDKAKGQKFKPFVSVSICALVGEEGDVKYVNYDVNIKGGQAKDAIEVLKPYLIDETGAALENKVLVGFRIGDAMPEIYQVKNKTTGEAENRVSLKGRLLKLTSAKVNGNVVELPKTEHDVAKEAAAEGTGGTANGLDDDTPY
jgi:hypothetical protein